MRKTFEDFALKALDESEGGYVNHPLDPGGHTNRGITLRTYRSVFGFNATVQDLKNITDQEVAHLYRQQYWNKVKGDQLPAGVDYCLFDYAVNSGPGRAAKTIQRIVGAKVDGAFGPKTLDAVLDFVEDRGAATLIDAVCDRRLSFLQRLKTWRTFKKGWKARVQRVRGDSLMLANEHEEETEATVKHELFVQQADAIRDALEQIRELVVA